MKVGLDEIFELVKRSQDEQKLSETSELPIEESIVKGILGCGEPSIFASPAPSDRSESVVEDSSIFASPAPSERSESVVENSSIFASPAPSISRRESEEGEWNAENKGAIEILSKLKKGSHQMSNEEYFQLLKNSIQEEDEEGFLDPCLTQPINKEVPEVLNHREDSTANESTSLVYKSPFNNKKFRLQNSSVEDNILNNENKLAIGNLETNYIGIESYMKYKRGMKFYENIRDKWWSNIEEARIHTENIGRETDNPHFLLTWADPLTCLCTSKCGLQFTFKFHEHKEPTPLLRTRGGIPSEYMGRVCMLDVAASATQQRVGIGVDHTHSMSLNMIHPHQMPLILRHWIIANAPAIHPYPGEYKAFVYSLRDLIMETKNWFIIQISRGLRPFTLLQEELFDFILRSEWEERKLNVTLIANFVINTRRKEKSNQELHGAMSGAKKKGVKLQNRKYRNYEKLGISDIQDLLNEDDKIFKYQPPKKTYKILKIDRQREYIPKSRKMGYYIE